MDIWLILLYIASVLISGILIPFLLYINRGQLTSGDLIISTIVAFIPGLNLFGILVNLIFWLDRTEIFDRVIFKK